MIYIYIKLKPGKFLVKMNFTLHVIISICLSFRGQTRMFLYIQNETFLKKLYNPTFSSFHKNKPIISFSSLEF